jgi:hypothetical protein
MADDVRARLARLIVGFHTLNPSPNSTAWPTADRILAAGWTPPDTAAADTRKAALEEAARIADEAAKEPLYSSVAEQSRAIARVIRALSAPIVPAIIPQE